MKVKVTHPDPKNNLQAGLEYDLPGKLARELIEKDWAFAVEKISESKQVTYGDRKNKPA